MTTICFKKEALQLRRVVANSIIVTCLTLSVMGCYVSEQAIEANIEQLKVAEAKLLQNPNDKETLSFVLNQLSDRRGIYRVNAAATLEHIGKPVGASIASQAVPALSSLLDTGEDYDKRAAAGALRSFGPFAKPALPALRKSLTPVSRDVAGFSAEAIGNIGAGAAEAVPDLLEAIKANASGCEGYFASFCESFIPALGKIGPQALKAVPDLESLLNLSDPYTRLRLAVALIRIDPGNRKALDELEKLLKDSDAQIRRRSLVALAECGKEAKPAKPLIETAVNDPDDEVRRKAFELVKVL